VAGFSPLIAAALVAQAGGEPWLVAVWMIVTAAISLVAFLAARETRDIRHGHRGHDPDHDNPADRHVGRRRPPLRVGVEARRR
jgi:hypothetical protein